MYGSIIDWCSLFLSINFFCLWFFALFYDLILIAFLDALFFSSLLFYTLRMVGEWRENFLWHFGDFEVRFLIKGLCSPHYYQNGVFFGCFTFPQHLGMFIYQLKRIYTHISNVARSTRREKDGSEREIYRLLLLLHPLNAVSSYFYFHK